jgi:hypothetical protein
MRVNSQKWLGGAVSHCERINVADVMALGTRRFVAAATKSTVKLC